MTTIYYPSRKDPELEFTIETQGDMIKIVKCEQLVDVHPGIEAHWQDVTKYVNVIYWTEELQSRLKDVRGSAHANELFDLGVAMMKLRREG